MKLTPDCVWTWTWAHTLAHMENVSKGTYQMKMKLNISLLNKRIFSIYTFRRARTHGKQIAEHVLALFVMRTCDSHSQIVWLHECIYRIHLLIRNDKDLWYEAVHFDVATTRMFALVVKCMHNSSNMPSQLWWWYEHFPLFHVVRMKRNSGRPTFVLINMLFSHSTHQCQNISSTWLYFCSFNSLQLILLIQFYQNYSQLSIPVDCFVQELWSNV